MSTGVSLGVDYYEFHEDLREKKKIQNRRNLYFKSVKRIDRKRKPLSRGLRVGSRLSTNLRCASDEQTKVKHRLHESFARPNHDASISTVPTVDPAMAEIETRARHVPLSIASSLVAFSHFPCFPVNPMHPHAADHLHLHLSPLSLQPPRRLKISSGRPATRTNGTIEPCCFPNQDSSPRCNCARTGEMDIPSYPDKATKTRTMLALRINLSFELISTRQLLNPLRCRGRPAPW